MVIVKNIFKGKEYCWPTHINSLLIDRKDAQGTEVFLTTIKPNRYTHRHVHLKNEQVYYVIKGGGFLVYRLAGARKDKKVKVKSNEIVFIPLKTEHQFFCRGKQPLLYITVDIFPRGKPPNEPTWSEHAKNLKIETRNK